MRDKCSYADKYKAIYPPKCGCKVCEDKWADAQSKRFGSAHKES